MTFEIYPTGSSVTFAAENDVAPIPEWYIRVQSDPKMCQQWRSEVELEETWDVVDAIEEEVAAAADCDENNTSNNNNNNNRKSHHRTIQRVLKSCMKEDQPSTQTVPLPKSHQDDLVYWMTARPERRGLERHLFDEVGRWQLHWIESIRHVIFLAQQKCDEEQWQYKDTCRLMRALSERVSGPTSQYARSIAEADALAAKMIYEEPSQVPAPTPKPTSMPTSSSS
eukprot:CAMPEP_0116866446 /NCGR_PEP_ID=MMETSP0418-20121206/26025_1 /TAXON_ID=1158023 /ORGANISM="Astrosyne radiata, Strain 13vi08-1A" /LENGTH=224 /DNA_ID=CAMNT_0004502065 /DNA_START=96 /DNA_END=766 /DNA_ORIENTATION=+